VADQGQIRQVIDNLITNACQSIEGSGQITVILSQNADHHVVMIRDNGRGVDTTIRDLLFDPLVTTKAKGTGLGLTICRQITERHGGTIELFESNERGSCFIVKIPNTTPVPVS
jgi:signal transduction histidine kinase